MNTLLSSNRELRSNFDPKLKAREATIHKIMVSYGYDRDNAIKVYEMQRVRNAETLFGAACGALAVYKFNPIAKEQARSFPLMRKAWMRYPVPLAVFAAAYHVGTMLPSRFGRKLQYDQNVTSNTYTSSDDLVGRFRLFDNDPTSNRGNEDQLINYLKTYSTEALTEPEIIARLETEKSRASKFAKKYAIKRLGKDEDDIFWFYGKVHGLENIAFLNMDELQSFNGNPIALQHALNNAKIPKG